jgi:hypothetical protein
MAIGIKKINVEVINFGFIIYNNYQSDKTSFLTPLELPLQFAFMNFKKGFQIKAHIHNKYSREIFETNEILIIRKGSLKVCFFNFKKDYVHSEILNEGDLIFLQEGGHSFEMIENCEFFEVKNGPYFNPEIDKIKF